MEKYTTGEMAKLCNVTVRTVQFYDTKNLLNPSELTEGGRRIYSEDDLKKMRLICVLKRIGLSLESIKGIMESENPAKLLLLLLDEQIHFIDGEIEEKRKQKDSINIIKDNIKNSNIISLNSVADIEQMIKGKRKLKRTHMTMLAIGIFADILEVGTIILWITKGIWLPFAIGMPIVVFLALISVSIYHKNVVYICPECNSHFKPNMKQMILSNHSSKARKLKCTNCGHSGWCIESAAG